MKARLLMYEGSLQLLLCTGKILTVNNSEAYEFLSNFDNPSYYDGPGKWDYGTVTMDSFHGKTIATVTDHGLLCIEDAAQFRLILAPAEQKLLSVAEYAELHRKKVSIVRRLCRNGRLPGAINKGNAWFIPEGTPYPADGRYRTG